MNTKYNKLIVLAIAGLMLAVVGSANVFADYSWSGYDGSKVQSSTYVWPYCSAYGDPFVMTPASCSWSNNLYDDCSAASYFNAKISWTDAAGYQNSAGPSKLTYHSASYTPGGRTSGNEGGLGDSYTQCTHSYSYNGGSTTPSTTYSQEYYLY